jgi:hypothetical protein
MQACVDGKGEKGAVGLGKETKMGQLTLSMGPARVEVCFLRTKGHHSKSKVYLFSISKHHTFT